MMRGARARLLLLAALAAAPAALAPAAGQVLPPAESAAGFAQADAQRSFQFPRDHGPHGEYRQEWWYLTGNLDGADGARFGFELTFFRIALTPQSAAAADGDGASKWRAREIYMAHFAITDVQARSFRFAQKLSRAAQGLAGAGGEPLRVWIDDWALSLGGDGRWHLEAAEPGYALSLTLEAAGPPVLNGAAGLSRKSADPSAASYYYSVPRLAARGVLTHGGKASAVAGLAWLDREWGSGGLGAEESGWDWFALQLKDGSALMFYALRDRDGGRDRYSAGTWMPANGEPRALSADEVRIDALTEWRSADGVRYPSAWRIAIPSVALELSVQPLLSAQELTTTPRYWEGAVDVSGARSGKALTGRGYVELVGYDGEQHTARVTGAAAFLAR
jgi:predicted secreted hydrolase